MARQEASGPVELYLASIYGGSVLKLNGAMEEGGNVTYSSVRVSSDSQAVIYRADQEMDEKYELFITLERLGMYLPLLVRQE
jgi:hypothetical protein